jgi:geranylgeranyl diphosphate synthase type II
MESIVRLGRLVEDQLLKYNWEIEPKRLYAPLDYFLKLGGKRIRPILSLMSAELFDTKAENVLPAAMSIELFHNFSLIHDDIMDGAPLRRKKQTVHEKWNLNTAILSGDVLLIKAYQELAKQNEKHILELLHVFNQTCVEVCEGQQMDMDFETRNDVSIPEYIEMIRLKTSVLLGCALEMGAIASNASIENRKKIYAFGQDLGIAFQIKDDLLDLYGDPEKFGKQIGGDVIANKKTLLYLLAKENATPEIMKTLSKLEKLEVKEAKVREFQLLYLQLNVPEKAQEYIDRYAAKAMYALESIEVEKEKKDHLIHLSAFLMNREN